MRRAAKVAVPLDKILQAYGLPAPRLEYRFHSERRWRFDAAFVEQLVAVEVDGGAFSRGRHTRGEGFIADQEKINEAQILGWLVIRCTPQNLTSPATIDAIRRALQMKGWAAE